MKSNLSLQFLRVKSSIFNSASNSSGNLEESVTSLCYDNYVLFLDDLIEHKEKPHVSVSKDTHQILKYECHNSLKL